VTNAYLLAILAAADPIVHFANIAIRLRENYLITRLPLPKLLPVLPIFSPM
jgi:hypothetical protein